MGKVGKLTYFTLLLAALLWFVLFIIKPINFWLEMSLSIIILVISALLLNRGDYDFKKLKLKHLVIGLISSILLYLIFYIGNIISGYLFPFKEEQILSVYSNAKGISPVVIGLLLLLVIGPGEEIYWRGFIQRQFTKNYGEFKGYVIGVIAYTAVHILTGNFMLVIAAFVCGCFWGALYIKEKSLIPVIISHALWDVAAFVLFPFH